MHVEHSDKSEYLKKENKVILSKIKDINKTNKKIEAKEL